MVLVGNKNDIRENRNVKVENETDADRRDRLLQRLKTAASLATSTVTSKDASSSSTTSLKTRIGSSESSSSSAPSWKKLTKFIENRKSPYIEASAKTGENVHKAFEMLVDAILARKLRVGRERERERERGNIIKVEWGRKGGREIWKQLRALRLDELMTLRGE